MLIYNYDRDTLEYTGITKAEQNPIAEGYLIPAFAVDFPPPDFNEFEKPFFINGNWQIKPYFKGKMQMELISKLVSKIDYIGEIKEGFIYVPDDIVFEYMQNPQRYDIRDNKLYRLNDDEYIEYLEQQKINKRIEEIKLELDRLDLKTIRALREDSEKENGITWNEYYLSQIQILKNELTSLQDKVHN